MLFKVMLNIQYIMQHSYYLNGNIQFNVQLKIGANINRTAVVNTPSICLACIER